MNHAPVRLAVQGDFAHREQVPPRISTGENPEIRKPVHQARADGFLFSPSVDRLQSRVEVHISQVDERSPLVPHRVEQGQAARHGVEQGPEFSFALPNRFGGPIEFRGVVEGPESGDVLRGGAFRVDGDDAPLIHSSVSEIQDSALRFARPEQPLFRLGDDFRIQRVFAQDRMDVARRRTREQGVVVVKQFRDPGIEMRDSVGIRHGEHPVPGGIQNPGQELFARFRRDLLQLLFGDVADEFDDFRDFAALPVTERKARQLDPFVVLRKIFDPAVLPAVPERVLDGTRLARLRPGAKAVVTVLLARIGQRKQPQHGLVGPDDLQVPVEDQHAVAHAVEDFVQNLLLGFRFLTVRFPVRIVDDESGRADHVAVPAKRMKLDPKIPLVKPAGKMGGFTAMERTPGHFSDDGVVLVEFVVVLSLQFVLVETDRRESRSDRLGHESVGVEQEKDPVGRLRNGLQNLEVELRRENGGVERNRHGVIPR